MTKSTLTELQELVEAKATLNKSLAVYEKFKSEVWAMNEKIKVEASLNVALSDYDNAVARVKIVLHKALTKKAL